MNIFVSKNDIRDLMKNYTEEERLLSQPSKMLKSSFTLQNGTLVNPLPTFYLQLRLACTKKTVFLNILQRNASTALCSQQWTQKGRRQADENSNSSVVAETTKLPANSSYGCQILARSRHTVTKYLSDKKHKQLLIVNCSKS